MANFNLDVATMVYHMQLFVTTGEVNVTRAFCLKPLRDDQFEKKICSWAVKYFNLKGPDDPEEDPRAIVEKKIDTNDQSLSRKIVQFIEENRATHYISSISLGAYRVLEGSSKEKSKEAGAKMKLRSSNTGGVSAAVKKGSEKCTLRWSSSSRGDVDLVKVGGEGEKKEYVIEQEVSPVCQLLSSGKLKCILESGLDIYCKRRGRLITSI